MRSSTVLAALGAALTAASPIHHALHNREIVWDIITEIDYVTVTEGAIPTPPTTAIQTVVISSTVWVNPVEATTSSTPPPPPPAPTTTSTSLPPPAPTTTTEVPPPALPAPTTTQEAIVVETPSSAPPAAASPSDYSSTAVDHHNYHRANHSAPDITWSDSLAASALVVAKSCVFAHDMTVYGGGYGQNLAAYGTSSSDFDSLDLSSIVADAITNQWYNGELANIPWNQNSPSMNGPEFLHATQVIWKATTQVGCATVKCDAGTIFPIRDPSQPEPAWYTVCNYGPEGNVLNEFAAEISEPLGNPTVTATIT